MKLLALYTLPLTLLLPITALAVPTQNLKCSITYGLVSADTPQPSQTLVVPIVAGEMSFSQLDIPTADRQVMVWLDPRTFNPGWTNFGLTLSRPAAEPGKRETLASATSVTQSLDGLILIINTQAEYVSAECALEAASAPHP